MRRQAFTVGRSLLVAAFLGGCLAPDPLPPEAAICGPGADCPDEGICAKWLATCRSEESCPPRPDGCPEPVPPAEAQACVPGTGELSVASGRRCDTGCAGDGDCPAGRVCEVGPGCAKPRICVAGCHTDRQCAPGEVCRGSPCLGCPCPGRCEGPVECRDNRDCPDASKYCAKAAGECAGAGRCAPRAWDCDAVHEPVCGCDGRTYGSACQAAAAGVNVAAGGPCKPVCKVDGDCPVGQVCELSTGCRPPMTCVAGCHADGDCGPGQVCRRRACLTCPCPGRCEAPPPICRSNNDCPAGSHYCAKPAGECSCVGRCAAVPVACDLVHDPVCGCDGRTYGNACAAAGAGVNVAAKGWCRVTCAVDQDCPMGEVCELDAGCRKPMICVAGCRADGDCGPGLVCKQVACLTCPCPGRCESPPVCKSNGDCPPTTHYCAKAPGDCGGAGECAPRPRGCPDLFDPVCGCDGRPYGNACEAAAAGVVVAAKGPCKVGCAVDGDCPAGQVCELDTGCRRPMICVPGCHGDDQCGPGLVCKQVVCLTCPCPGRCESPPGCKSNGDCPPTTHYCAKAAGDCGGAGQCAPRPGDCPDLFDPVCGCDGRTYGNACEAGAAGVVVAAKGPCKVGCGVDGDCPAGQVCELDTGCRRPLTCVPGCHGDDQCGSGQICQRRACLTCPCPGVCAPAKI